MFAYFNGLFNQALFWESALSITLAAFSIFIILKRIFNFFWLRICETNKIISKIFNLVPELENVVVILTRLENNMSHVNQKVQAIVSSMGLASFEADKEGLYTFVSKQWVELTGLSINEAIGNGWVNAICEESRSEIFNEWKSCLYQNREFHVTTRLDCQKNIEICIVAWPIRNLNGTVEKFFGILI